MAKKIIGIPKEIKDGEQRVVLIPAEVKELCKKGYQVYVQQHAGVGAGYVDDDYRKAGAKICKQAKQIWQESDLVVKVKEPLPQEFKFFRKNLKLFCFLHLAANPKLAAALKKSHIAAFGFETYLNKQGKTEILRPMSEIAGRLSITLALHYLRKDQGGRGILLSPTLTTDPGHVVVVGGGAVGLAAVELALGLQAKVSLIDLHPEHFTYLENRFPDLKVLPAKVHLLARAMRTADVVIGAVHVPGAKTAKVIRKWMVQLMSPGSVLVDVAVDQGGASETTHVTSLSHPVYVKYGVTHVAIPNMPAMAPRTASQALSKVVAPHLIEVLNYYPRNTKSLIDTALNVYDGELLISL